MSWTSPPLACFTAMAPAIEARFGPPAERDLDSNGVGLFDAHVLRFGCGLEVALWRFHGDSEPSTFEIHANQRDLAHIAFHLGVPVTEMSPWIDRDGTPVAAPGPRSVIVVRSDDNGNEATVTRVTSRCEAEAIVREYEARGHKQLYWIADDRTR